MGGQYSTIKNTAKATRWSGYPLLMLYAQKYGQFGTDQWVLCAITYQLLCTIIYSTGIYSTEMYVDIFRTPYNDANRSEYNPEHNGTQFGWR